MNESERLLNDLCLKYREYSAVDAGSENPPLILLLHGRAANGVSLFNFAPQFEEKCIVLCPRAPIDMGPDSYGWFYTTYPPGERPIHDPAETEHSRRLLVQFINESQDKYKASPSRTYLVGFSQGAIMAFSIALHFPKMIAGIAALSGRIMPEHAVPSADRKLLEGFPVLLSHGTQDEVLSVDYARSARRLLEELPISLNYREHPIGHEVSDVNFNDVKKWLSSLLRREPGSEARK